MQEFRAPQKLEPWLANPGRPFIHRDLSWLQFNNRVLAEARSIENPVLERLKFLSISASNLDEFFMIRMASLARKAALARTAGDSALESRLKTIRDTVLKNVLKTHKKQSDTLELLRAELRRHRIFVVTDFSDEEDKALAVGKKFFDEQVLPSLEPIRPFSVEDLSGLENLRILALLDGECSTQLSPKVRPVTVIEIEKSVYVFFVDALLRRFLPEASGFKTCTVYRATLDSDLTWDMEFEDATSIPDVVRGRLGERRLGKPMRLQSSGEKSAREWTVKIAQRLKLDEDSVFETPPSFCLGGMFSAIGEIPESFKKSAQLVHPPLRPKIPAPLQEKDPELLFKALREQDLLLHHPYDSFDAYVNFIRAACQDPKVTQIAQTVYRMDMLSPVIAALKDAAKTKRVQVVVELRARFEEANNLALTHELREAGAQVHFGFGKLKLHAKTALVVRQEDGAEVCYSHLSTGNYHSVTAKAYTDLALLTSNAVIGEDVRHFFDFVAQKKIPQSFKALVAAPTKLHRKMQQLIQDEIEAAKTGQKGYIFAKVNALVDEELVAQLYTASQAGVKVDLIVRGACSLIPGLPGLSENIRVRSIVDRFLEHSRIYYFARAEAIYLSSADWMPRNFFSRLELAFPIQDPKLQAYLKDFLIAAYLKDNVKARELGNDGRWHLPRKRDDTPSMRAQFFFAKGDTQ